jgi:hypothetical protein
MSFALSSCGVLSMELLPQISHSGCFSSSRSQLKDPSFRWPSGPVCKTACSSVCKPSIPCFHLPGPSWTVAVAVLDSDSLCVSSIQCQTQSVLPLSVSSLSLALPGSFIHHSSKVQKVNDSGVWSCLLNASCPSRGHYGKCFFLSPPTQMKKA